MTYREHGKEIAACDLEKSDVTRWAKWEDKFAQERASL